MTKKKILGLILVCVLVVGACGVTQITKWVINEGGPTYLYEKDTHALGNEIIVLDQNGTGNLRFSKAIEAQAPIAHIVPGYMTKAEYAMICGNADKYKFEEIEWGGYEPVPGHPLVDADIYINKQTITPDVEGHHVVSGFGHGSDTMTITSGNWIIEYGQVAIGDAPYLLAPPKGPDPKPPAPPLPPDP